MLYTFDHDETGTSEDIDFFSLSLSSFVLIEEGKKIFPSLSPSLSLEVNEFFEMYVQCLSNERESNEQDTARGRKKMGGRRDRCNDG